MELKRVGVVGVASLGGSIGLAMRSVWAGCVVVGYGHRKSRLEQAKAMGAIDEMTTDAADAAQGCDLIVLCTPVGVLHDLLKQVAPSSKAVITDVGSTKGSVVATAEGLTKQFVGSHPMAGSEKRGVEFA